MQPVGQWQSHQNNNNGGNSFGASAGIELYLSFPKSVLQPCVQIEVAYASNRKESNFASGFAFGADWLIDRANNPRFVLTMMPGLIITSKSYSFFQIGLTIILSRS